MIRGWFVNADDGLLHAGNPNATLLSGGEFGPEGSVLIIPVLLLALFAMRLWTRRRKPPEPESP